MMKMLAMFSRSLFILLLCLNMGFAPLPGQARPAQPVVSPLGKLPGGPRLLLRAGAFDPLHDNPPVSRASLLSRLPAGQPGLRLVQFLGPIQETWFNAMQASGLEIVSYMADYGYLVWGDGGSIEKLAANAPLRWSGNYHPAYALHPALQDASQLQDEVEVIVQVYQRPDSEDTLAQILKASSQVFRPPQEILVYTNLGVRLAARDLEWLAGLPGVVNVEPRPHYRKMDEVQGQIMAGNLNPAGSQPAGPGYLTWLTGLGFSTNPADYPVVDITDDGIDNGTATPIHADFYYLGNTANPDRLVYNVNWTSDPLPDGRAGHGNINASIVGGYNNRTGTPYEDSNGYNYGLGINPFGRVAGSKVFRNSGSWDLPGDNFAGLISQGYNLGARISSNSWGANTGGAYTTDEQAYDALVRDAVSATPGNQEITIVFAAGNAGSGSNTVGSPGNAKNVITVGAAENYRPTWTDGCNVGPSGADNANDIIYFSSRGPTDDSRVKPEIVAPGTHIQGAASQAVGYDGTGVCDQYMPPGQTLYAASSGTSHSTPAIAGAASLVYRYYQTRFGGQPPSPAMVKAYMVNATRYLNGVGANDTLPSNNQGFGEINLGMAFGNLPHIVVDQSEVFGATGQVYEVQGTVADPSKPFRVTLTWSDPPGPTSGAAYINNLDLEVLVNGQTYKGNVFSGSQSITGGSADPRNNTESVFLPAGASGLFTVRVKATNIAGNGLPGNADPTDQDFALDIYNARSDVGYLDGTVSDGTLGGALQGASIQVITGTLVYTTATSASGYYTLTVKPDVYTVSAWKYGYTLDSVSGVTVVKDLLTTRNFTLYQTPLYNLSGCVTDLATSAGLASTVKVFGPFGDLVAQTTTTQSSNCYNLNLYGGVYTVTAAARLHQTGLAAVTLNANKTQDFSLIATTTDGLLWGKVTNQQTGNPVSGATVTANPGGYSTNTDGSGDYELQLPPGTYTVSASAPLYSSVTDPGIIVPQSNLLEHNFALPTAHMVFTPAGGIAETVKFGQQATRTLRVDNTGSGSLDYNAFESSGLSPSGGPDAFGYVYLDSRTAEGVAYNWIDATDGSSAALGDDEEINVTLPFNFNFYGLSSNLLRVGNNGAALFNATTGDVSYTNVALGSSTSNNLIAPFWDDLDSETGAIYYKTVGTAPNRAFVVEWYNRPHYNGVGAATFELILYEGSNNLKFQYLDVEFGNSSFDYGASATVGIQGTPSQYLQAFYNQPNLASGVALCFQYPGSLPCEPVDVPWLSAAPLNGNIPAGNHQDIQVDLDAAAVAGPGVYTAQLRFFTNDPEAQPYVDYPITMTVPPPPPVFDLQKTPAESILEVGHQQEYHLSLENSGGLATQVTFTDTLPAGVQFAWASNGGALVGDKVVWSGFSLAHGASVDVTLGVTLTCVVSGTEIVNNDYWVTAAEWLTPTLGLPVSFTAKSDGVTAGFSAPSQVMINQPVNFVNTSQNATAYSWDFGDGNTSNLANPTHTFTQGGVYTVALLAKNLCSSDTITQNISVENYAVEQYTPTPNQSGAAGETLVYTFHLTNTGTLPDSYNLTLSSPVWSALLSTTSVGPLNPGQSGTFNITVRIPAAQTTAAQRSYTVTATSVNDPRQPKASAATNILATFTPQSGVQAHMAQSEVSGEPGDVITFTLQLTNTGNLRDSFNVSVAGSTWVYVPTPISNLNPSQMVERIVTVSIPAGASPGTTVVATIRIQSARDATVFQVFTLTIHVIEVEKKFFLPIVMQS